MDKVDDCIGNMKNKFKVSKEDTEQSWFDKCDALITDANDLKLKDNFN